MDRLQKYSTIFSLFLMMNLFLFFYLHYRTIEREQMFISNSLYSTWNVVLRDSDLDSSNLLSYIPNDGRLFFEHDTTGRIRSFYQHSNWQPPLIEGDFFDESDDNLQAVVGIHVLQNLENINLFEIAGRYYEIVGILGAAYPSPLDHLVLLNNGDNLPTARIIVDANNPRALNELIDQFEILTVNENQAIMRFLNSNRFDQFITLNVWTILGVLTAVSAFICFDLFKRTYAVFSLIGYEKAKVFKQQVFVISSLFLMSMISVVISHFIFGKQFVMSSVLNYLIILVLVLLCYTCIVLAKRSNWR